MIERSEQYVASSTSMNYTLVTSHLIECRVVVSGQVYPTTEEFNAIAAVLGVTAVSTNILQWTSRKYHLHLPTDPSCHEISH